jgi:hypothetical protein
MNYINTDVRLEVIDGEKRFYFKASQESLQRLPIERIEMIYMMAFRGLLKELRNGSDERPYAMLFRSRVAALMDIRIHLGWLVEIDQFLDVIATEEGNRLRSFYESWLREGDEHGISFRLSDDFDLQRVAEQWREKK